MGILIISSNVLNSEDKILSEVPFNTNSTYEYVYKMFQLFRNYIRVFIIKTYLQKMQFYDTRAIVLFSISSEIVTIFNDIRGNGSSSK